MAVPTLKVPARRPTTVYSEIDGWAHVLDAMKVYLNYFKPSSPWLGLNFKYTSFKSDRVHSKAFNTDFDTVFLPQATQQTQELLQRIMYGQLLGILVSHLLESMGRL